MPEDFHRANRPFGTQWIGPLDKGSLASPSTRINQGPMAGNYVVTDFTQPDDFCGLHELGECDGAASFIQILLVLLLDAFKGTWTLFIQLRKWDVHRCFPMDSSSIN